jgi:ATP-dependent helicase/nuclease subunit A
MTGAGHGAAAADPRTSVWVAASAGTGKTTVLTERLLRLMLDGADPARILCLTFTRAAAAEMANRLDAVLADWVTRSDTALADALQRLTGRFADMALIARARRLFALVLDAPGGIKISTIHAFCQTLLRRFPLEAGVSPEFAVIEERGAEELLAEATQRVIGAARAGRRPELADALSIVADHTAEEHFGELMRAIVHDRSKLRRAVGDGDAALWRRTSAALVLPEDATMVSLVDRFCTEDTGAGPRLRAAAAALAVGSATDRRNAAIIGDWWAGDAAYRRHALSGYEAVFLRQNGDIRKVYGDRATLFGSEAERVSRLHQARAAVVLREASSALTRLGEALLAEYDAAKRLHGVLDFEDLVARALALLRRPGVAPWVLFKLDGGLDHILIDEAQDTNPDQWQIVAALAEEFFAGEGGRTELRTIFAVGDVKQSIFSFQRADPQAFLRMRTHFEERVNAAGENWNVVPLAVSFRSTEPVLAAVDAIFRAPEARDGVALEHDVDIGHVAERVGHAGLVELWPPVAPAADQRSEQEALPVARIRAAEPSARLARAIAARIRGWLDTGERLAARDRPVRPGDIMVLVRRRNEFVGELLRALKQRDVPVGGADRLLLTEQLAVQDLIALGRFLLFPEDDLTLAALLKSPLFDVDEDILFALCHGRGSATLWSRVRSGGENNATLSAIADRLSAWLARADFVPPYELYAEILGAEGGRHAMRHRLGPEAEDPVAEFLGLALAYEREQVPSLQGFLRWLASGEIEVKRDFAAHPHNEVRILTVHGAKGLEAPIVFLPDTMSLPDQKTALLWTEPGELPLWKPPGDHTAAFYAAEKARWRHRQMQEYRRLLYVGLTRAQDRLYICGWQTTKPPPQTCWYALCRAGLAGLGRPFAFDAAPLIGDDGWSGDGLRIESPQQAKPKREPMMASTAGMEPLAGWARQPPPSEPEPPRPLVPSRPDDDEPATLSPVAAAAPDRFKRGSLIHSLLQTLPDLRVAEREAAARRFLASPAHALATEAQDEILCETLAILAHPDFAPLFGPDSLAEVPVIGLVGGRVVSGRIDRLVVTADRVLIVDYKTLRLPPTGADRVPPAYLHQLAGYRAVLARLYPGREIRCALLWTEGPRLMPIEPARLASW